MKIRNTFSCLGQCVSKTIISFVRVYQYRISPLFPQSCRFYPSCSEYTVLAIKKYGPLKGVIKTFYRVIKCHPFCKGGIDFP